MCNIEDWIIRAKKADTEYIRNDYEDLFFILNESVDKKEITNNIFKKIVDILMKDMNDLYMKESRLSTATNFWNSYGVSKVDNTKQKQEMFDCLQILLYLNPKKVFTKDKHLYIAEKFWGKDSFENFNIKFNSKSYLTEKLNNIFYEKYKEYTEDPKSNDMNWYDEFLNFMVKNSVGADKQVIFDKSSYSVLGFIAAIELGYEPSEKEIKVVFANIWDGLTNLNKNNLHFFCNSFIKTNVFKHSLAPAKNIQLLLKDFFGEYIKDESSKVYKIINNFNNNPIPHEEKVHLLLNHPTFLHANITKKFFIEDSVRVLGKKIVSEEEIVTIKKETEKDKPILKKIKI